MSRLTIEETFAAADELNKNGINPTTLKLRDKLGKGSFTTITAHLQEWSRKEEREVLDSEIPEIPEDVQKIASIVWEKAYRTADKIISESMQSKFDEIEGLKSQVEEFKRFIDRLDHDLEREQVRNENLVDKLREVSKQNGEIEKESERLREIALKIEEENRKLKNQISEMKKAPKPASKGALKQSTGK